MEGLAVFLLLGADRIWATHDDLYLYHNPFFN